MGKKLNLQSKSHKNYFQIDFMLNDKDAIFVYDLEQIIKKDRLYSLIREIGDINFNLVKRKNIFQENKFIYNEFITKINFIIDSINTKDVIKQFLLENKYFPEWEEFAQLSKWINCNEVDLKRGNVFIEDLEASIFKRKYINQLKIKKEFINSHIFLCLNTSWKYHLKYKKLDFKALFLTSMNSLHNSIDKFLESLKLIKKDYLESWKKAEIYIEDICQQSGPEPKPTIDFDSCIYAEDFLEEYISFLDIAKENIECHILNYLINHIELSECSELFFQR